MPSSACKTIAIVEGDGEGLDLGLVLGEVVIRVIGNAVVPGDHATHSVVVRVAADATLFPYTTLFRSRDRRADAVGVGEVDVAEANGAGVGQIAGRGDLLGDRAGDV